MAFYKRRSPFGCCSSGPALGSPGPALGQLDEGTIAATSAPELPYPGPMPPGTLRSLFAVSVGAGLTVWAVTRWLSRGPK
jgi:hypothetical protein